MAAETKTEEIAAIIKELKDLSSSLEFVKQLISAEDERV